MQIEAAQAALEWGEEGAAERLAAAEQELENALEAVLEAECAGNGGDVSCYCERVRAGGGCEGGVRSRIRLSFRRLEHGLDVGTDCNIVCSKRVL